MFVHIVVQFPLIKLKKNLLSVIIATTLATVIFILLVLLVGR